MARIRTIKPEFPQSESMGRVSRDARLLFVLLWTICDDAGRARAAPRMLASLLYPYDDDANTHIVQWLFELERQGCIVLYEVDGNAYLQIEKWLSHQKIDRPSKSRFPEVTHESREPATNTREPSSEDLGPRTKEGTKDLGPGPDTSAVADALDAYNEIARELSWPVAQTLTPKRTAGLRKRLDECGGIDGWRTAMAKARASPFLRGETGRDQAHEGWAPDLDFFLQQSSFTKLMEGRYDQRSGTSKPAGFDALRAGAARAAGVDGQRGQGMASEPDSLGRLAIPAIR